MKRTIKIGVFLFCLLAVDINSLNNMAHEFPPLKNDLLLRAARGTVLYERGLLAALLTLPDRMSNGYS